MERTISAKLFATLERGKKRLGKEAIRRITDFVVSQQTKESAFKGKNGKADLYYTVFGWTLSRVLGIKMDIQKMDNYLAQYDSKSLDFIHFAAYTRCKLMMLVMNEKKRGGLFFKMMLRGKMNPVVNFAGEPHSANSPYIQYLTLSMTEDVWKKVPNEKEMLDAVEQYHLSGGGYVNIKGGLTATTNATVAALAVKGQLQGYKKNDDAFFLRKKQEDSGGFRAAEDAPIPDLLSTATALFILNCYGIKPLYPARDFIEAHWLDSGGFAATLQDDRSDVEYLFYGLLALGSI